MRIAELPERSLTGIVVEGGFDELGTLVPAAWRRLAGSASPRDVDYVEFSRELGGGRYREILGVLPGAGPIDPALAPVTVAIPAGPWLIAAHEGPRERIAETFARMLEWAAASGHAPTGEKTDIGYRLDGRGESHELGVRIVAR